MLKVAAGLLAAAGMVVCLWAPIAYFLGYVDQSLCRGVFAAGSLGWFVGATIFASRRKRTS